jgi:hypothetical protein
MAVFTAIAGVIANALGGGIIASFAANFLVSTAMGLALNALAPKTSTSANAVANSTSSSSRGYSISGESGSAVDHQIIYGRSRVGGVRLYDASTGGTNQFLHRIIGFAGHEIQSYDEIYLNDEVVTLDGTGNVTSPARYNGFVRIRPFYGTTTQTADPDLTYETSTLTEGRWTVNHRLLGIAYIYARFNYDPDVFPNGIPIISATIKGRKVYDPRTTTTAWSDNPALCIRDYLTSSFGLSQTSTQVDDASITTAANICEEVVDSEDRYTCNGSFVTGFTPSQVISDLLTSMGGLLWYSQGQWRMKAAKYVTPTITLDEDDLRSGVNLSTRHSRRNNFNTVKGKFKGPESTWQEADYPTVTDPVFVTADNNLVNILDFPLPYTTSSKRAQRIANIALRRNREQLTFSASFGLRALGVEVGDFVNINNTRFGWVNKPFEVSAWTFGLTETLDLQVQMTLREISSAVFTDEPAQIFENNNTTLPSAFYTEPVGLNLSSEVRIISESITDVILATVTASQPGNVERVEVQFKKSTDSLWSIVGVGDLGIYEILVVDSNITYDVRARSYSYLGLKSDWTFYDNFQPSGLAAPPAIVDNFRANLNGGSINLEWNAVPDLDLSHYRIRHSIEESGASFANATTAVEKVSRPATSITVPTRPGTYSIRAYDKIGNASLNYSQVVVPNTALETFTNNLTSVQSPTFSGTKTGCSLTGSELRITTTTSPPTTATYVFTTYIDTGAVRRVRARVDVNVNRFDANAGTWDAIPGLWDSIPGFWDDWTGGSQYDDIDVVTYISFTSQDPAGTPTWSPYQPFKAGDFYGRAFRFKIDLESDTSGVSPSISGLTARVQYN